MSKFKKEFGKATYEYFVHLPQQGYLSGIAVLNFIGSLKAFQASWCINYNPWNGTLKTSTPFFHGKMGMLEPMLTPEKKTEILQSDFNKDKGDWGRREDLHRISLNSQELDKYIGETSYKDLILDAQQQSHNHIQKALRGLERRTKIGNLKSKVPKTFFDRAKREKAFFIANLIENNIFDPNCEAAGNGQATISPNGQVSCGGKSK